MRKTLLASGCAAALLLLNSCATTPPIEDKKILNQFIGKPAIAVLRSFGTPDGHYKMSGHLFLSYKTTDTAYSPGMMDWGYDGMGFGDGFDGWGDGIGMGMGFGPVIPPTYQSTTCQTTFEIVKKVVRAWRLRGTC